jgi:hypothetical protein
VLAVFGDDHVGAGDAGDFGDVGVVETASVDLVVGGAADEGEPAIAGEGVDDEALHDLCSTSSAATSAVTRNSRARALELTFGHGGHQALGWVLGPVELDDAGH